MDNEHNDFILNGLSRSLALIKFDREGNIVFVNQNFLNIVGYDEDECIGKHHSIFVDQGYARTEEYKDFWDQLRQGKSFTHEFKRFRKDGSEFWIQASYTPIFDSEGSVSEILKIGSDVTSQVISRFRTKSILSAIERSTAFIEFSTDGVIKRLNEPFLKSMRYSEGELEGQHHRIFVKPEYSVTTEYKQFWRDLANGITVSGRVERVAKDGSIVWLEATYNPIINDEGEITGVIKFATDVTESVNLSLETEEKAKALDAALQKSIEAERVREEMDRAFQEMSTPVTPIWDGILLLPLIGIVDSTRTDDIMRKTLQKISESQAKVFILDISGVPTVDTSVANQLMKITKATKFMGCETVISGLSPLVAHTMVDLGVDVGEVITTSTLKDAFRLAQRQVRELDKRLHEGEQDSGNDITQAS